MDIKGQPCRRQYLADIAVALADTVKMGGSPDPTLFDALGLTSEEIESVQGAAEMDLSLEQVAETNPEFFGKLLQSRTYPEGKPSPPN